MVATLERMGRPKKPATRQMRFREDLAMMLDVICAAERKDAPDLTDEMFRETIQKRYDASLIKLDTLRKERNAKKQH